HDAYFYLRDDGAGGGDCAFVQPCFRTHGQRGSGGIGACDYGGSERGGTSAGGMGADLYFVARICDGAHLGAGEHIGAVRSGCDADAIVYRVAAVWFHGGQFVDDGASAECGSFWPQSLWTYFFAEP